MRTPAHELLVRLYTVGRVSESDVLGADGRLGVEFVPRAVCSLAMVGTDALALEVCVLESEGG